MSDDLRLVIFDVDGTLVDSQVEILAAMQIAFDGQGIPCPSRQMVLSIVGLSLPELMLVLAPDHDLATRNALIEGYKSAYMQLRDKEGPAQSAPLYPGARDTLAMLQQQDHTILGVATGKSKRGLDAMLNGHQLNGIFFTQQVADHHPSKPHPAMVLAAIAEAGVDAKRAIMIGDTTYDMQMGRAAGVKTIGVSWGYHAVKDLQDAGAHKIATDYSAIPALIEDLLETDDE